MGKHSSKKAARSLHVSGQEKLCNFEAADIVTALELFVQVQDCTFRIQKIIEDFDKFCIDTSTSDKIVYVQRTPYNMAEFAVLQRQLLSMCTKKTPIQSFTLCGWIARVGNEFVMQDVDKDLHSSLENILNRYYGMTLPSNLVGVIV
tara:strand:+ start:2260 stop:2700 length:441 start_codon:yes stop_codon:yes gene_type:complete